MFRRALGDSLQNTVRGLTNASRVITNARHFIMRYTCKDVVWKKQKYKTVSVRADMGEIKEKVTKQRQNGTKTVTKTKGFLKKETYEVEEPFYEEYEEWVPTGKLSDTFIDIESFSQKNHGSM